MTAYRVLGLSGLALVCLIAAARIPTEERALQARFAGRWDAYRRQTGALVPRLGGPAS